MPPATRSTPSEPSGAVPAPARAGRSARDPRDTPAMRQYRRFKESHPDCVLFFRMGDFYEMFDEDAVLVHEELGLTLTQRTEGIPMAGVPYHALDGYLQKMIAAGHRVAVCDQIQDPKEAKGVVDRAVTRVLTPGTLVDEALLDESVPNLVAAVTGRDDGGCEVAVSEVSTGRFDLFTLPADRVHDELVRLRPNEILHPETPDGAVPGVLARVRDAIGCATTARPGFAFHADDARERLLRHHGVRTLSGFGLDDDDPALGPAGALLTYLHETQAPDDADGRRLGHLRPPRRLAAGGHLLIDASSLRSLEIERTMRSGETAGSLLAVFPHAKTAMGKRLLRQWLCFPLCDRPAIEARQTAVASLVEDTALHEDLLEAIGGVQDVARIVSRVSMRRATPRDLVALGRSTGCLGRLVELLDGHPAFTDAHARLAAAGDAVRPLARAIVERCVDAPPAHLREGGLFRDGVDDDLDHVRGLERDATDWLAAYQARLTDETAIPSLKVGFNRVFGYYIEVTHTHASKVPPTFTRKQTLKNAERYVTPELKTFEDDVTSAQARAVERERVLFEELCAAATAEVAPLLAFADVVAELDVLACFAATARRAGFVRPTIVDDPTLEIAQGRHPVLDRLLGDRFVPNDCTLGGAHPSLALITGPNMAGKSTAIRQAALIVLLAHTGSFVPAESAVVGLADRIFTRIGASDELHQGQSTFMVEMVETANILHHATERSVVVLDEIGRGTSTLDGLALAWAIAESIASIGCRALFATHYHELTALADSSEHVANHSVSARELDGDIVFLHRLVSGATDRSYGIHVAKIAGLPRATIDRAGAVLESLAVHTAHAAPTAPPAKDERRQLELFAAPVAHPAVDELRRLRLDSMSPLDAFDALRRLLELVR